MILRFVPSASLKLWGFVSFFFFFENKTESSYEYPSTTQSPSSSQSGVMILYIFPICNSTDPFIYLFQVLRIICLCVPLSASLKVTSTTKLFLVIKQRLMKKKCFVLEISRFLCFCDTCRFQNVWRHKYWYIMQATLMLVSFES